MQSTVNESNRKYRMKDRSYGVGSGIQGNKKIKIDYVPLLGSSNDMVY